MTRALQPRVAALRARVQADPDRVARGRVPRSHRGLRARDHRARALRAPGLSSVAPASFVPVSPIPSAEADHDATVRRSRSDQCAWPPGCHPMIQADLRPRLIPACALRVPDRRPRARVESPAAVSAPSSRSSCCGLRFSGFVMRLVAEGACDPARHLVWI